VVLWQIRQMKHKTFATVMCKSAFSVLASGLASTFAYFAQSQMQLVATLAVQRNCSYSWMQDFTSSLTRAV